MLLPRLMGNNNFELYAGLKCLTSEAHIKLTDDLEDLVNNLFPEDQDHKKYGFIPVDLELQAIRNNLVSYLDNRYKEQD